MATIRIATESDLESLIDLGEAFIACSGYADIVGYSRQEIADGLLLAMEKGVIFVAEHSVDGIVGGIAGAILPLWFSASTKIATELAWWITPAHRGGRNAVRLLAAFEAWAVEQGAAAIALSDFVVDPSEKMFKRLGYSAIERTHIRRL